MLHQDVLMKDIDVNHWRNLQSLVLESAKERRRIIVIHEGGTVLKLVHSHRLPVEGAVTTTSDPRALAEALYRQNSASVDFVAVFERKAFDEYFGRFQATWRPDEDLDEFVHRAYALIDEYPDGIVTYPGPARSTLGLQWRLGASFDQVKDAVQRFVTPDTSVVFGIMEDSRLWATLVLRFDADLRADVVTTVDMSEISGSGSKSTVAAEVVDWVERRYGRCSVALFSSLGGAREFLAAEDKAACIRQLLKSDDLLAERAPEALAI